MTKCCFGIIPAFLSTALALHFAAPTRAAEVADFPPGMFTDNGRYSVNDLQGKVVVLFFFEESCPKCRGLIPDRNMLVASLKNKPVKFIAVDPGHTLADSTAYATQTKFVMPVFADPLRIMEARWKEHISLQNIYQWKVISPEGKVVSYSDKDIAALADKATWKYKDKGYNTKLAYAVEAFEWGQYAIGMRNLKPFLKNPNRSVAEDALKLFAEIKTLGEQWKSDGDKAVETDPIAAFDLYSRVADVFAGDELAKSVADPLKKLKTNKAVKDEMAARQMYDQLAGAMSKVKLDQKAAVAQFCQSIATKYPETPTGKKAAELATELGV